MAVSRRQVRVLAGVALVAGAFLAGAAAARLLGRWGSYHQRHERDGSRSAVCRAEVLRVAEEQPEVRRLEVRLLSGRSAGEAAVATQHAVLGHPPDPLRAGDRCLVVLRPGEGPPAAQVVCRERDGYLVGMAAALAVFLCLMAGRKGLATVGSVAWAMILLLGVLLPAAFGGARTALWCVPLSLAIAAPTLLAIGGPNRKSLGAIGGALCGIVAGGLVSLAFTRAMSLTGLEVEFGPYHHLENVFWYSPATARVDFASLLVAGMLLAGLGAVMDVSMAVASTVAEVRASAPEASRWTLVRAGLAAGRDILGAMVFTLALVYVGSHLVSFVSLGRTGWAGRWTQLGNFEELATELARMAAAALGMALCVPASALLTAVLHTNARPSENGTAATVGQPSRWRMPRLSACLRPLAAGLVCLALAGLADEWTLRSYLPKEGEEGSDTVGRVVAFDEPVVEPSAESSDPRDRTYFRSRLVVVQPYFGPRAGEMLAARLLLGPNPASNLPVRRGMALHIATGKPDSQGEPFLFKLPLRYRWGLVALLVVAATLLVGAGRVGLRVLLVMAACGALMGGVLLPALAAGYPPLLATAALCTVMLGAAFAISGALDRKAFAACAGCAIGVASAAALFLLSSGWLRFTGTESVPAQFLSWLADKAGRSYDYRGLFAAALLVALFGLALDTAVTVAAGVSQVCAARPGLSRGDAVAAGVNISRDVVGTMALTLVFAYVGLRLPVFLLPAASGLSAAEVVNGEAGSAEILHVLVGVAALAITGAATALVAACWIAGAKASSSPEAEARRRRWPMAVAGVAALAALAGGAAWWSQRAERLAKASSPRLPVTRDGLAALANEALRSGRTGDAVLALWTARERFPDGLGIQVELAYAYAASRWIPQARREIEAALAAGADDAKAHYVAGVVYAWGDEPQKAESHLRKAAQLDPANAAARAALEALFGQ